MSSELALRVATFNIRNGRAWDGLDSWPFRRRATAAAVARLDADLIGLQEVYGFQQRYLQRRLRGYEAAGVGRNDGRRRGERCTVLYRATLLLAHETTLWFADTPDRPGSKTWESRVPRIVTLTSLAEPHSGRRFGFANLHWEGASRRSRELSAALLVRRLDTRQPWIVAGDFNATPDDPSIACLLEAGLRDVLPEAGATEVNGGRRIDYIFVSHEWQVEAASVQRWAAAGRDAPRRRPSDHWPLVADLRLE